VSLDQSSNRTRNAIVGGALLVAVVVIWFVYGKSAPQSLPQPTLATARAELVAIGAPAGATAQGPAEEEYRIGTVKVSQRFELQQSAPEARARFRSQLLAHGWQLKSEDDATQWADAYCKSSFVAYVKLAEPPADTTHLALSITWNELSLLMCGGNPA
jgi:hypothetical protein